MASSLRIKLLGIVISRYCSTIKEIIAMKPIALFEITMLIIGEIEIKQISANINQNGPFDLWWKIDKKTLEKVITNFGLPRKNFEINEYDVIIANNILSTFHII